MQAAQARFYASKHADDCHGVPANEAMEFDSSESRFPILDEECFVPCVLVVDDDPMVCMAIESCLHRLGFDVIIAEQAEAAAQALEATRFDLMLLNVFTPRIDGFEAIRIFRRHLGAMAVIAIFGLASSKRQTPSEFLRATLELGATLCLRKPFTPAALLAAVNTSLALRETPADFSNRESQKCCRSEAFSELGW